MKIQALNNTNFRGLFTDKSAQNGGNWRMEYSPYSWESSNTSKMANKKQIDIFASALPDNEEIYTNYPSGSESSKDILGTESYYVHSDGKMRRTITEMPAMNREESLIVQNKKLTEFEKMKHQKAFAMENSMKEQYQKTDNYGKTFDKYYNDASQGYFSRRYSLETSHDSMKEEFNNVKQSAKNLYDDFSKYAALRDSIDNINIQKFNNEKEIGLLSGLRKSGLLIDISRRDIPEPNKALQEVLQNIKTASAKFLALPHKTIFMQDVLRAVGAKVKSADIPAEAIKYVDTLIKKGI